MATGGGPGEAGTIMGLRRSDTVENAMKATVLSGGGLHVPRYGSVTLFLTTEDLGGSGIHRILLGIRYADLNLEERTWLVEQWRGVLADRKRGDAGASPPEAPP